MPSDFSTYTILPAQRVLLCYTQGKATYSDLIELNLRCINDENFNPEFDIIMDFRSSYAIGYKFDIIKYINFYKQTISLEKPIRCSLLLRTPNQRFLFSIYKPLAKIYKIHAFEFSELCDCLKSMKYSDDDMTFITNAFNELAAQGAD